MSSFVKNDRGWSYYLWCPYFRAGVKFNAVVCDVILSEAESTVTKAHLYEDDGQYAKASPNTEMYEDEADSKSGDGLWL